ncbi:MAG: methyltransferase domain-containing protein [Candidatus Micrarchaeaceae archaeon]
MFLPKEYRSLKRGPQVMLPKDIGIILAYSSIGKESICVEGGTGNGWLTIALARVCKEVYSYEIREDFIKIAEKNIRASGVKNIVVKNKDIYEGIDEKGVDLIVLDLPEPGRVSLHAFEALRAGGYLAAYIPNIEQAKEAYLSFLNQGFSNLTIFECILRDWVAKERVLRPSTKGIWHTGFIVMGDKPESGKG